MARELDLGPDVTESAYKMLELIAKIKKKKKILCTLFPKEQMNITLNTVCKIYKKRKSL